MKNTFIKMLSVMMAMVIALGACAITVYAEDELAGGAGAETTHTCSMKTINAVSNPLETCVGQLKRYKQCETCGKIEVVPSYTVTDPINQPNNHYYDGEWTVTGDVENGWQKVNHCYLCDTDVAVAISTDAHDWESAVKTAPTATDAGELVYTCKGTAECATGCTATYSIVILAEDGTGAGDCEHTNKNKKSDFSADCQPSYSIYECADCSKTFVADFAPATSHNWKNDPLVVTPTCDQEGYTCLVCDTCGAEDEENKIVYPAGHRVVADGDVIDNSCGNTDFPEEGVDCYMCQAHFDREAHNYAVTDDFAGDCLNAPYTTYTCDCGDTYTIDGTIDENAHDYQVVGEPNTDVFASNIGTKVECSVCHHTKVTQYLYEDIFFSFVVKNSSDTETAQYAFVNGGHKTNNKVIVELYIHSYDADAINTMQFDFKYNTTAFELNNVTANTEIVGKKDVYYNEVSAGTIRVVYAASNEKNAEGNWDLGALQLSNAPVLFATIELNIKDSYYDETGVKKSANIGSIDTGSVVIADKEHNELFAKAQDIEPIVIYKRGDISGTIGSTTEPEGDGKINAVDLSWMLEIVASGDYTDVRADLNLDGVIDSDDFALMRNWLLEKVTYPATK